MANKTFSITFGDVAENHKGMQMIGQRSADGFTLDDLQQMQAWFEANHATCRLIPLHELLDEHCQQDPRNQAYILVVKKAANALLGKEDGADMLFTEQDALEKDTKAFMYGRVVNKHARHNLCFGEAHQEPDYANGKGTVYAFDEVPLLHQIREKLGEILPEKASQLQAEGNYYYNVAKCGIGYHGDAERKKVIAFRLGANIPLCYAWFHNNAKCSDKLTIPDLEHGDMYVMSEKATGYDWRSKSKYTLRHAAGCDKYTKL
ncbi:MAG: hypothetical protein ACOVRN_14850 [Flavobacterium sp.]